MTPEIAARLDSSGITMAAQARDHCMFVRGNCMALVQVADERFTSLGSSGLVTEKGLAYLVWRDGEAMLSSHGNQAAADADQVATIKKFSEDLREAIWPPMNADERR